MFFLNKRSNFEKKTHELSYRSNIYTQVLWIIYKNKNIVFKNFVAFDHTRLSIRDVTAVGEGTYFKI